MSDLIDLRARPHVISAGQSSIPRYMNYAYSKRQDMLSNHFERVTKFIAGTADRTVNPTHPAE